jgi:thioesterase domain-containing protein
MIEENNSRDASHLPQPSKTGALPLHTFPPRTSLERELARIWEQVLQHAPIGIREDFFELGGNSIHAALIVARIEERFRRHLPLSVILCSPTIEQLAAALLPGKSWNRRAFVVPIQAAGENPALFCVGGGAYWRAVSENLGPGQPVFNIGLELPAGDGMWGRVSLEEISRHVVSALREEQPQGPFYLCGYCRDGVLAYEVARQLTIRGREVGLLALIEARNPSPHFRVGAVNGLRRNAIRFAFQLNQLYRLIKTREFSRYARARRRELERFMLRVSSWLSPGFQLRAPQPGGINLQEFLYLGANHCKLKPLGCPTAIFRCTDWPILSGGDPYFGWRELLTGRCEIHEIPGVHEEIFSEPNVRELGAKLSACLQNARKMQTPHYDSPANGT